MLKSAISSLCLLIYLIIPYLGNATVAYNIGQKQNLNIPRPYDPDFIKLDQKVLVDKIGRELNWKEKIVFKKIKKRQERPLRKSSKNKSSAVTGFLISLISLLLVFIGFLGWYSLILFGVGGGIIGIFVNSSALKKIKRGSLRGKGFAIIGLIIGIIITGSFIGALISYLDWAF